MFTFSDRFVSSTTPVSSRLCLLACSTSPGGLWGFLWLSLNSFVSCSSGSICQSEQRVLVFLLLHHKALNMFTFCMFSKTVKWFQSSLFQNALDLDFFNHLADDQWWKYETPSVLTNMLMLYSRASASPFLQQVTHKHISCVFVPVATAWWLNHRGELTQRTS